MKSNRVFALLILTSLLLLSACEKIISSSASVVEQSVEPSSTQNIESSISAPIESSISTSKDSATNEQNNDNVYTFPVVLPDIPSIHKQEDIVPYLKVSDEEKILLPKEAPIYLRSGEQVDASYIGLRGGYTVDVVCESFDNTKFEKVKRIIVNQTHEQVDPYIIYHGEVHSFGRYFYFTVNTNGQDKALDGNYILHHRWDRPYFHLLATIPTNTWVNHIAILAMMTDENGEEKYAGEWDYGPIIA